MTSWDLKQNTARSLDYPGGWSLDVSMPEWGPRQTGHGPLWRLSDHAGSPLPPLEEAYVRGRDLIASYPQRGAYRFGVKLAIAVHALRVPIWEFVVAVQTDDWDCHPILDFEILGSVVHMLAPPAGEPALQPPPSMQVGSGRLAPPMTLMHLTSGRNCLVMMPPRDWPVTGFQQTSRGSTWRLFEEFLEKGVIRKARLWVAWLEDNQEPHAAPQSIGELYAELCRVPLPLTA